MENPQGALHAWGLRVSNLPEKGRCLLTTKNFYAGDVVLRQEPYVCVPNGSMEPRCDGCFKSDNLKKCSGCQVAWFCCRHCQKSEWNLHRLECSALSRLQNDQKKSVTPSIRLMLKLCIRRKLQKDGVIPLDASESHIMVDALVCHMKVIEEKQLLLYAQMAHLVWLILRWPDMNIKEIAEDFSKLSCNAHTICDSELKPVGTGLYPFASMINHSCLPNAVLVFDGKLAVVRAVCYIPLDAEVLISYIDTAASTSTRQKVLREQYLFTCMCPRCIKLGQQDDIQESAILEGFRCKNDGCRGFLLPDSYERYMCQHCGFSRSSEEVQKLASKIKVILDKALHYASCGGTQEALNLYEKAEQLQRKLCHPFSVDLMRTHEILIKMSIELEKWMEALRYCRLVIPVYKNAYSEFHPLLGLHYYTTGKLEWLVGDIQDATESFTNAANILKITHGANTPFVKELMMKLDVAQTEASHVLSTKDE